MGTCDKCKHWDSEPFAQKNIGCCDALDISGRVLGDHKEGREIITTFANFGCNRFEEKPIGPFVVNRYSLNQDFTVTHKDEPRIIIARIPCTPFGCFEAEGVAAYLNELWQERDKV